MSRSARITLAWGDGDHEFRLPLGQLQELEAKTGRGPQDIQARLIGGLWTTAEVRETLRLGLIGGGCGPIDALALVKRYVDDRPWLENVPAAVSVISAAISGVADDPVGELTGEGPATSSPSQTADTAGA